MEIRNLTKVFKLLENKAPRVAGVDPASEIRAVDNLSLELNTGEIFVLLGQNGAGKTTLIQMLTGTLEADEGVVKCFGDKYLIDKRDK